MGSPPGRASLINWVAIGAKYFPSFEQLGPVVYQDESLFLGGGGGKSCITLVKDLL